MLVLNHSTKMSKFNNIYFQLLIRRKYYLAIGFNNSITNHLHSIFRDLSLNINEFSNLLKALFRNEKGRPYPVDDYMCNEIFMIFNKSGVSPFSFFIFRYCKLFEEKQHAKLFCILKCNHIYRFTSNSIFALVFLGSGFQITKVLCAFGLQIN